MKLILDGKINPYYVQTLCMIFFPGEKFGAGEETREDAPVLKLSLREESEGICASVFASFDGKAATAERFQAYSGEVDRAKTAKLACGAAVISALGELLGYRPSWGMLTGVRPSKVATELLQAGMSKTRVKKTLNTDYFVIPKKRPWPPTLPSTSSASSASRRKRIAACISPFRSAPRDAPIAPSCPIPPKSSWP